MDTNSPSVLTLTNHPNWVSIHPLVLALTACSAELVHNRGGLIIPELSYHASMRYVLRMGLFDYLRISPPLTINPHEESGRFIPITKVISADDASRVTTDLIPLLHAPPEVSKAISYVISEMLRNVLEHASSPSGAIICAQYYASKNRISIGIADSGVGIFQTISHSHKPEDAQHALRLALMPGITGTTSRIGGSITNAGAGLFFTKSIAALSRNYFILISDNSVYRLLKNNPNRTFGLNPDPWTDRHETLTLSTPWPGTAVGLDIALPPEEDFSRLLDTIRISYRIDVKEQRDYSAKIRFS